MMHHQARQIFVMLIGGLLSLEVLLAAPSADALVDRYIQAAGGEAAIRKLKTRQGKGIIEIEVMGMKADVVFLAKAPNKRASRIQAAGLGEIREGCDGRVAWTENPGTGVVEKSGADLARAKRDAVFSRELEFNKLYPKRRVLGSAEVGGKPAWVLEATTEEGNVEKFYLDAESGLLVRHDSKIVTPMGEIPAEIFFEDYRTLDGVTVPFRIRMPAPAEMAFTLQFSSISHNEPIEDSVFAKP